jgi:hypothetical protein
MEKVLNSGTSQSCWAKYVHAHVLCKWFNSITFVNYRAQKLDKYSIKQENIYCKNKTLLKGQLHV